jgi:hypothetical protein
MIDYSHCVGVGRFRLSSFRQILGSTLDNIDLSTPASARHARLNFLAHVITRLEEGFRALLKSTEDAALDPVLTPLDSWLVRFSHLHRQSFLTSPSIPLFSSQRKS